MVTSLASGEVHVWRANLDGIDPDVEVLDEAERRRADALRLNKDRRRFIAARSLLRHVLAEYTRQHPAQIVFDRGPHGKPLMAGGDSPGFNLSHAANMALIAISREDEVGVDLEGASLLLDPESVVRTSLSQREQRLLGAVRAEDRTRAILQAWVRKEAVAKGRGEGLVLPLNRIETPVGDPASGHPITVRVSPRDRWFIWDIPVGEGCAGALAARGGDARVRVLDTESALPSLVRHASLAK